MPSLALAPMRGVAPKVKFVPHIGVHSPDIRFLLDRCVFPHKLEGIDATFSPEWMTVNNGDAGIGVLVMGRVPQTTPITRTLPEGEYYILATWEQATGEEVGLYTEAPIKLTDLINGTLDSSQCIGLGWYLGYYVEAEETIYLTDAWGTYTYILPWLTRAIYFYSEDAWREMASGRFIIDRCTFPYPPQVPAPDETITPRIEFEFAGLGPEYTGGWGAWTHHYRPTFYSEAWKFIGSINLMVDYGAGWVLLKSFENPTPQTFVWALSITIEELLGTIEKSKLVYIHFGLLFHMLLERWTTYFGVTVSRDSWIIDYIIDYLSYSTFVKVPAPPPPPPVEVYPYPVFIPELCSVSKTTVRPNEEFVVTLTVENTNKVTGDIYLGYTCEGMWHEVRREAIGPLERKTYNLTTTAEQLAGRSFGSNQYISAQFCIGYVEPGMPVGEYRPATVTYRWTTPGIAVLVSEVPPEEPPEVPPEEKKIPWEIILPVAGAGVILYGATRRK